MSIRMDVVHTSEQPGVRRFSILSIVRADQLSALLVSLCAAPLHLPKGAEESPTRISTFSVGSTDQAHDIGQTTIITKP